ncbi:alpha/beta hydrolase fold protein [Psychromonas ingrahamii 37]|uniref:Alpha/beta hydrolase fold protein n=1 Tax=Psychromonas ingrahamii (strain DSM 17664 / CCUG 51855 / 37) TaxID=357804 RepID=A1SVT4_PSYIN|nr:alpha/beta hydrolase [Psychromonas ingrahamii]ABM03599.1 alpha/beta hydrolase fold protein [Psychromonas ingrahamii 37]
MSSVILRNNVKIIGKKNAPILMLAHGFGCDQNMWQYMLPELESHYKIILFDYVGSGNSLLTDYSKEKYSTLEGYAKDIVDIIEALNLKDVTIIAHSVSSIIASIAAIKRPELIKHLVMVCPSPCFLNIPPDYEGGFERSDLEDLIELMDKNYIGWANYLAPLIMGNSQSPELIGELSGSFCSTDPLVAKTFAKATFFSDHRHILKNITCPVLILQSASDSLAGINIGYYMAEKIAHNELAIINAEGHCLHMTNHQDIIPIILRFIGR